MTEIDSNQSPLTDRLAVSVLTACRETKNGRWATGQWDVIGVVAAACSAEGLVRQSLIRDEPGEKQYLWSGYYLELFKDAADGYYHNLMSEDPKAFVICQRDEGEPLEPYLVTVSYDEAAAHMEVEEDVFSVPLPPELYRFVEHFVLAYYAPEKRKKRKREDWKSQPAPDYGPGRRQTVR